MTEEEAEEFAANWVRDNPDKVWGRWLGPDHDAFTYWVRGGGTWSYLTSPLTSSYPRPMIEPVEDHKQACLICRHAGERGELIVVE